MRENRRGQRVDLLGSGTLHHADDTYSFWTVNISENGALVRLKKTPINPPLTGDVCRLLLYQPDNKQQYQEVTAQIVRIVSDVIALQFTELEMETHNVLNNIIQKELHFVDGGQKIIDLVRESAGQRGIELAVAHFDTGELNPEREMHTLRLSSGENSINVYLHRDEIEAFYVQKDSGQTITKINHAIERLDLS